MNRKQTYIGIAIVVFVFGIFAVKNVIQRISNGKVIDERIIPITKVKETNGELLYIAINGKDKKVPAFKFINQNKDTISDKDYRGKVFLVEFFFTRCTDICIPMNHNLQAIAKMFEDEPNFGIASFSIDPEHDTSDVMKKYATDYGVTNPNWHFMTGDRADILKLSNEGFYLATNTEDDLENGLYHSGLFALIDQNGFIRSRPDNTGNNPKPYYRGSVPIDAIVGEGEEAPEIDILIEDIKKLLK